MPTKTKLTRVRVSATEAGTFANVGYTTSFDMTEGTEGDSRTYYFGGVVVNTGDPTLSGTIAVMWEQTDADGQDVIRAAKRSGDTVWLQFAPEGTETGAKVEQLEAHITEVSRSSDAGGDLVTGSFSFTGDPDTLETITLA